MCNTMTHRYLVQFLSQKQFNFEFFFIIILIYILVEENDVIGYLKIWKEQSGHTVRKTYPYPGNILILNLRKIKKPMN